MTADTTRRETLSDTIRSLLAQVDADEMTRNLFYLAKSPLPCRTVNTRLPGHAKSTLDEADDFIAGKLESWGYAVEREAVPVRTFRPDPSKAMPHAFSMPGPADPLYDAYNLYAKKVGRTHPDESIVVIAHKDSQSWVAQGPGAGDNAIGTAGAMEIARCLSRYPFDRSIWFVFCNEEHAPWTSASAAQRVRNSGMKVAAALNLDGIGGKPEADRAAGRMTNVTRYTTPEGEVLADLMAELNTAYAIGLIQSKFRSPAPNDDDGSFIKAGFPAAVLNIGSFPYQGPGYHSCEDKPEAVDVINAWMATRLSLAFVAQVDAKGPIR